LHINRSYVFGKRGSVGLFFNIASGTVVRLFGIGADKLAIGVVAADSFEKKSTAKSLEAVLKLAFFVIIAKGNRMSSFRVGA